MTAEPSPDDTLPRDGVPPELIEQLHQANEQFARARQHLDESLGPEVLNPQGERERASNEVHEAEERIENIEEQVETKLKETD
jgi:hypothetical protein